jgi:glycine cleavage system H protein
VIAPARAENVAAGEYCVPGGAFVSPGHAWARIDPAGQVWTGLDDFARKALKSVERVELPAVGSRVKRGEPLFTVRRGDETLRVPSPLSGEVTQVNEELKHAPRLLIESPYDRGWACLLRPSDLAAELAGLRIGKPVVAWYQEEIARLRKELEASGRPNLTWADLEKRFFGRGVAEHVPVTGTVDAG